MTLRVTLCAGDDAPGAIETVDTSWQELEDTLRDITETDCQPCRGKQCPSKRVAGWLPVVFEKRYRTDENVASVTLAVFDLDHLSLETLNATLERLAPYRFIVHSTHTHNPPDDTATRLVMALSHPISPREWRAVFPTLVANLGIPADPVCKNPSRFFYAPTAPRGNRTFFQSHAGEPLDIDTFLALKPPAPPAALAGYDAEPMPENEPAVELSGIRGLLVDLERTKARSKNPDPVKQANDKALAAMLARIREGLPIAVAGDHVGHAELPRGRDAALNQAMSCFAFNLPPRTPWEAVAEIVRETVYAMSAPEGQAHWMAEAEDQFRRAQKRRADADAANERAAVAMRSTLERIRKTGRAPNALVPNAEDVGVDEDPDAWKGSLWKNSKGEGYASVPFNASLILMFAADVKGTIRWNDVTRQIDVHGGPFAGTHKSILDTTITDWLAAEWGIQLGTAEVGKRILAVARNNSYDPLMDYLRGLKWDGKPRIHTWLRDYCGAIDTRDEDGRDITELVDLIGARCLMSLAARGLRPGCKVDDVMILEGEQDTRKTSALEVLGGEWYVSGESLKLGEKDSKLLTSRAWLIEMPELTSVKKGDVDTIKAFLSTRTDVLRPPYGSAHEEFPRRCVFVGTLNPEGHGEYLGDKTGNRRFRPIRCEKSFDLKRLAADRDQLFAEAVARVDAGERWWFEKEENREIEERITNSRVAQFSARAEEIRRWWFTLRPAPAYVMLSDVIRGAFPDMVGRTKHTDEVAIGRALSEAGFDKKRPMVNGTREYRYYPSNKVKPVENAPTARPLTAIANAKAR